MVGPQAFITPLPLPKAERHAKLLKNTTRFEKPKLDTPGFSGSDHKASAVGSGAPRRSVVFGRRRDGERRPRMHTIDMGRRL